MIQTSEPHRQLLIMTVICQQGIWSYTYSIAGYALRLVDGHIVLSSCYGLLLVGQCNFCKVRVPLHGFQQSTSKTDQGCFCSPRGRQGLNTGVLFLLPRKWYMSKLGPTLYIITCMDVSVHDFPSRLVVSLQKWPPLRWLNGTSRPLCGQLRTYAYVYLHADGLGQNVMNSQRADLETAWAGTLRFCDDPSCHFP